MEKIFLKDEYERIFSRIANGDNITVLRYGDGERAIMTGEKFSPLYTFLNYIYQLSDNFKYD